MAKGLESRGNAVDGDAELSGDATSLSIVALVGRRDMPTDAIWAYCTQLGGALADKGVGFEVEDVAWAKEGWIRALRQLSTKARGWRGKQALLQYTALGWSHRGFPLRFLLVVSVLRLRGVRVAIVYHDPLPFGGTRLVDRIRRRCQTWVMAKTSTRAALSICTLPSEKIGWLPTNSKAVFIPVGANIPRARAVDSESGAERKTIAVFGITGGKCIESETHDIAVAARRAGSTGIGIHILLFGRNSLEGEPRLRQQLANSGVTVEALGLLEPEEITKAFSRAHVALFVRGGISSRRGSAIAALACGLPVVAYESVETAPPVTEAGVLLAPFGDIETVGNHLGRILSDERYRSEMCRRSRAAHNRYFAWPVIADSFIRTLAS